MQFSNYFNHFNKNNGIVELMTDLEGAIDKREDICMLGGGNPASIKDMENRFRDSMERLLKQNDQFEQMIGNYDRPQGNRKFIDALSSLLNDELNWPVKSSNIAITNGSQASFGNLFNLFSGKYPDGSIKKILLPMTPEYIGYRDINLNPYSLFVAYKPVIEENLNNELFFKYRVDFKKVTLNDGIGAICISRPTNPTGNVITDLELEKISKLAMNAGIPLIIDSAYGMPFPGITFGDVNQIWNKNIILCLSLSKLGLPGIRTGIVIADEDIIHCLCNVNAICSLSPGRFGPTLMSQLIISREILPLCQKIIKPYYQNRANEAVRYVQEMMSDIPVRIHLFEGGIFLWLWFKNLPITSENLYQNLKKKGVFVIAGHHFFHGLRTEWKHQHECIRISYSANSNQVKRGIQILADEVRQLYSVPVSP